MAYDISGTAQRRCQFCSSPSTEELIVFDEHSNKTFSNIECADCLKLATHEIPTDDTMCIPESMNTDDADENGHSSSNSGIQEPVNKLTMSYTCDDMSIENLKEVQEQFLQCLCCPNCSSFESDLRPVEGLKGIRQCSSCNDIMGLDDTINYYDIVCALKNGQYSIDACPRCGNTNPALFKIELDAEREQGEGDEASQIHLVCLACENMKTEDMAKSSGSGDELPDLCGKIECVCGNKEPEQFHVFTDDDGNVQRVQCCACNQFFSYLCSCSDNSSHDINFDEYGYISQLVCRKCNAEINCDGRSFEPQTKDNKGPKGRTRVEHLNMLRSGDHIAWHQPLSYWHHAIIVSVNELANTIKVINYDGPNASKGLFLNIVMNFTIWLDLVSQISTY